MYTHACELIVWLNIPTLKLNGTTSPSSGAKMAALAWWIRVFG